MVRPLRIPVEDGWYHVFGRGIERRDIFADARDREHFLQLLEETHTRYRIRIHAYALMDNHYHGVFQTPEANLSQGMQWLHGSYSAWYNARHDRVGPLFQGRFRAIAVEGSGWAFALSLYVHLNPLRVAGLGLDKQGRTLEGKGWRTPTREQVTARLRELRGRKWTSYRAYAGYEASPPWLETAELLARAHAKPQRRQAAYRAAARNLLAHGVDPSQVERLRDAVAIGSASFALAVRRSASGKPLSGIGGTRELRRRMEVAELRGIVEELKGAPWENFAERYGDWGCALFLWGARRLCGLTLGQLGEAAGGMGSAAVSKAIRRLERQAMNQPSLRALQDRLLKMSQVQP